MIKAGQSRVICFELKLNYCGFKLGCIDYRINAGVTYTGNVKGPLFGYTLPHT